jgi:hypothetical protein
MTTLRYVSFPVIPVVFSLYTVYHFHLLTFFSIPSGFVVSLLFLSLRCSFFYFSVPFLRFVCLSLPPFSSFHHLLFIGPLIVYFCFLTSRRLDYVSHADCECMFSGMWRRVVFTQVPMPRTDLPSPLQGVQIGLQFHPESAGWMFLRKIGNEVPRNTAWHPRRLSLH